MIAFAPRADVPTAGADTVRLVVPKYVAFLVAPATVSAIGDDLGIPPDVLEDAVEATAEADSGNLEVVVTLTDPELAAEAADAFALAAADLSDRDELLQGEVVVNAVVASTPSGPPRRLFEASALLVGLLAGVTVALLVERARPRVRSWRDIYQLTGYTVIGRIPRARGLRSKPEEGLGHPMVGAAVRTLRTSVERLAQERGEPYQTVVVTSPTTGDGKTTISSLFAAATARLGHRVLLVDGDMRRPNLTRRYKLRGEGLAAVLRGEVALDDAIEAGWTDNLWVLSTATAPDGGDLVAKHFGRFLEEAQRGYDLIVIDTPPLIGTDEGRTIATLADGLLLVVRAGSQSGAAGEAALALEALKVPVLGAVGNQLARSEIGQYYA